MPEDHMLTILPGLPGAITVSGKCSCQARWGGKTEAEVEGRYRAHLHDLDRETPEETERRDNALEATTREDRAQAERDVAAAAERAALLSGRLESLREAVAEVAALEERLAEAASTAAAYARLVELWRATRVAVLETSIIPSLEDLANEVLAVFPYGLAIRLATQRDRAGGAGVSETLDVEVVGPATVYELLSGGQRTTVDLALHVALSIVVSRRASTRLRFLYLDEPEGLDAPGRAALAVLVRRLAEERGLAVLIATHHEDLVDALAGTPVPISGVPGDAVVG